MVSSCVLIGPPPARPPSLHNLTQCRSNTGWPGTLFVGALTEGVKYEDRDHYYY